MTTRLVTDSSADLPADQVRRWGITVVPCYVVLDDVNYKDGVDLLPDDFYRRLAASPRLPTTAQPAAADFQRVYRDLLGQGHQVVSIHLSRKLSGTLNSAEQAWASLGDSVPIEIIDSQLTSIGLGLVVLAAAQQAHGGAGYQEVAERVRRDLSLTHAFFLLDTLEFLQKGGRVGKAQAFVGSLLSVKPILKLQDGEAHPVERPRNRERALNRLVELVRDLAPVRQLAVIYSTEPEQAEALRRRLAALLPEDQIITSRFGPVVGTYLGPGALGVALTSER